MTQSMDNETASTSTDNAISGVSEFFHALEAMRGINALDWHLLDLLRKMEPIPPEVQTFLCLCFSLWDDGNTFVSLNKDSFLVKWGGKWDGLKTLRNGNPGADKAETERLIETIENGAKSAIPEGIKWFEERRNIVAEAEDGINDAYRPIDKPLAKVDGCLYFSKYFQAKRIIETKMGELFKGGSTPDSGKIEECIEEVRALTGGKVHLKKAQAEAVLRGQTENLVVTGGPGTGKTTVVFYILWKLLSECPKMLEWPIYLAAPSGKAAERMSESLKKSLSTIGKTKENGNVYGKIERLEGTTIHRLLKYNPSTNGFSHNKDNQFPKASIFVIDEASMIDVCLFASLLQAIPKEAKVFILGDPYQLPSVDAGAVLGEILEQSSHVELNESNRFPDGSKIGKLAQNIKKRAKCVKETKTDEERKAIVENVFDLESNCKFEPHPAQEGNGARKVAIPPNPELGEESKNKDSAVSFFEIEGRGDKKREETAVENIVKDWLKLEVSAPDQTTEGQGPVNWDFHELCEQAEGICPSEVNEANTPENCDKIWSLSLRKRMLSAEREGLLGVKHLNKVACDALKKADDAKYFPGQLLMIVRNLHSYDLYNGDTGIVILDAQKVPYILLKKKNPKGGDFTAYPLSLIPSDAIESAFAITIHKSQGSEYDHVTLFLPRQKGHPLLNNQILYTGVTRAKKSVEIIATEEAFKYACKTRTDRDTGIEI